jgi:hypothetical protein
MFGLTTNHTIQYSRKYFEKVRNQNERCMWYISRIRNGCMPDGIKKGPMRSLINVLQRNANYLDFYYYTIDDYLYNDGIVNDDFNRELKQWIQHEFTIVSTFLDTLWIY